MRHIKKYTIPMEVSEETIIDFNLDRSKVTFKKIGFEIKKVYLVETEEEIYKEYMRPEWRESKRLERSYGSKRDDGKLPISIDYLKDKYNFEIPDSSLSLEDLLIKKELLEKLDEELEKLNDVKKFIIESFMDGKTDSEISRKLDIGVRAVNKKRNEIVKELKEKLKNY